MRLSECDRAAIRDLVRDAGAGLLAVIVAPNFEKRSLRVCETILEELAEAEADRVPVREVRWLVLTLQGKHAHNSLDSVKASYAYRALTWINSRDSRAVQHNVLEYPLSPGRLGTTLLKLVGDWKPTALLADFSALPRNAVFQLLKTFDTHGTSRGMSSLKRVLLAYAWARSYPDTGSLEAVGGLTGHFTGASISDFIRERQYVNIVLVTSGSVHDSFSVVNSVAETRAGRDLTRQVVTFMNAYNFQESWKQLRNHYSILDKSAGEGWVQSFVFSIRHALSMFEHAAEDVLAKAASMDSCLVICPFGPKPLAVGAQLIVEDARRRAGDGSRVADMFNSSGSQYLSTYSIGAGVVSLFEYSPK